MSVNECLYLFHVVVLRCRIYLGLRSLEVFSLFYYGAGKTYCNLIQECYEALCSHVSLLCLDDDDIRKKVLILLNVFFLW